MRINVLQSIRQHPTLTAILLGSFFLCIFYSFYQRIHPVVDAKAYDQIAVNLAQGFGFREDRTKTFEFDHAITRAGPGYEFFLAGIYKIFGHRYEPVWILQAFLHALSAFIIYHISRRIFSQNGEKIGIISAGLFAFWPDLIEISAMLMTETLYLFLTVLVVYLFARAYEKSENTILAGCLGAATGLAILTRPPLLLFVPIFLFFYWRKKQCVPFVICFVSLVAVLTPWTVRNYRIYHQFIPTTMIGEYNIWLGNTLNSDGGQYHAAYNPLNDYVDREGFFGLKQKATSEFWGFVRTHPGRFFELCVIRFIRYFSPIRPMGFWFYQSGVPQIAFVGASLVWMLVLFALGFSGMATAFKKYKHAILPYMIVLALSAPVLLLPTVVQSRYRFQIYPFLALFAAYALVSRQLEKTPLALLAAVAAIDIVWSAGIILERLQTLFS